MDPTQHKFQHHIVLARRNKSLNTVLEWSANHSATNTCWFIHEALDNQIINENNENKENNIKKHEVEKAGKKRE